MPEINHIKNLRNNKSLSINEVVKRTGFVWKTVRPITSGNYPCEKGKDGVRRDFIQIYLR